MKAQRTVTAFNVNLQSRDHSLVWFDADNGKGESHNYSTQSYDKAALQRAIQALKNQNAVHKLACKLGTIQMNLERAYKAEREQAITLLIDANVVTHNAIAIGEAKSGTQLYKQLGEALDFLAAVYCRMDKILREGYTTETISEAIESDAPAEPTVLDASLMSIEKLIIAINKEPELVLKALSTNRAKNLLELASRKLRKGDLTANWQAVAKQAINFV